MIPLRSSEPHYTRPTVTLLIIVVNVLVFLYELSLAELRAESLHHAATASCRIASAMSSILTSMFIHGGFLHIAGNMWFLWIFGRGVEDLLGHAKYLFFYFACGVAAAFAAHPAELQLHRAHRGRERRHRRRDGRLSDQVSARAYRHAGLHHHFHHHRRYSGGFSAACIGSPFSSSAASARWVIRKRRSGDVAWFAHVGGFLAGMGLMLLMPTQAARPGAWYWQNRC